jgi:hypothetical protein
LLALSVGGIPDSKEQGVDRGQKHHRSDGSQREPKHDHDRHRNPEHVAQQRDYATPFSLFSIFVFIGFSNFLKVAF